LNGIEDMLVEESAFYGTRETSIAHQHEPQWRRRRWSSLRESGLSLALSDRGQIEHVVLNLVVNERDAMTGGGTVTIETTDVELENSSFHEETIMGGHKEGTSRGDREPEAAHHHGPRT
jgi:hypothetical protein